MPELFNRVWSVAIGSPGQAGRKWDGLRISFKIEKTGDSAPNKLELSIFNLSPESRQYIEIRGLAVIVEAGYKSDGAKLLFSGSLERVTHTQSGADWESKIESADGIRAYRSVILSESFGPKTSERTVIKKIAEKMGVTLGDVKGLPDAKFNNGRALTGSASRELDTLTRSRGLTWSIQDGALQILPAGQSTSDQAVLLSPETGLVGSPEKTEKGFKATSLLQGGINPGRLVKLDSANLKGFYIAQNITHEGDSHGGNWYTELDLVTL